MQNIINGRNLNLYYKYNGITYPACFATDCKLTLTADTQETTTKNSLKGKTFNYQGKYGYTLSLRGITSLIDIPILAAFNSTNTEVVVPFTDSNAQLKIDGVEFFTLNTNQTRNDTIQAGKLISFIGFSENDSVGTNPTLTMLVYKDEVLHYAQTIANIDGAGMIYNITSQSGSTYRWSVTADDDGTFVTPVNIPDTVTGTSKGVNVGTFQDYILLSNKMDFIFTDNENIEWSGTVLLTQVDNDSPVDNVSTFSNAMLGDGELIKVISGVIPPPAGLSVIIRDQLGDVIATIPAPGEYTVTRFDSIDLGDSTMQSPLIIITQS